MRYFIMSIVALTLIACSLSSPVAPTPVPPPPITFEPVETVAYWILTDIDEVTPRDEDYVFIEQLALSRIETATPQSNDIESNLAFAIGAVLMANNIWQANDTVLESVTVEGDLATIRLNGNISAVGGAILSLVPTQFLLTIFEDNHINQAIITLNGETIGNIVASQDSQLRPADFIYTRESLAETLSSTR